MDPQLAAIFLDSCVRRLRQHISRIGKCLDRLTDEQVWARGSDEENAIANLMLHLGGNVRQWIVASIGGKPDIRVRDREFSSRAGLSKAELLDRLSGIVEEACEVLQALPAERLSERVTIQNYENLTIMEASFHVVEHFAMHTGQIMFSTKMLTHEDLGFYRHLSSPAHGQKTP